MQSFKNILVGIDIDADGSITPGSLAAVKQALLLAERQGSKLSFAHVIDVPSDVGGTLRMQPQSPLTPWLRQVEGLLRAVSADARNCESCTQVLFGSHWRELIFEAMRGKHDLILVGTRGRSGISRALLGSTGNRLLRYAPCPVWAVKPGHEVCRSVLVAHDLGNVGENALRLGASIASLHGARLQVLHVLEHPEQQRFLGSITPDELAKRRDDTRRQLERHCQSFGIAAEIVVREGSAYAEILDQAAKYEADVLCLGTQARHGLRGIFTGNTAENVLPWVDCSVLAVKPDDYVSPLAQQIEDRPHETSPSRARA